MFTIRLRQTTMSTNGRTRSTRTRSSTLDSTTTPNQRCQYFHKSTQTPTSKSSMLIPSQLNSLLQSDKHIKYHFHSLGGDFIRLSSYRKFKQLFTVGGGSLIKEIVFDLSTFLKRELNDEKSGVHLELKNFLTSNNSILKKKEKIWCLCDHQFGLKNWLYIIFGYMLQTYNEEEVHECLDDIIQMYLNARKNRLSPDEIRIIRDERDIFTLNAFQNYIDNVRIREDLLYGSSSMSRFVSFTEANNKKIYLPPLPRIHNRELLVKALMHKEFYRVLLDPRHKFAKTMKSNNYDLSPSEYGIVRKEISFLDGLGDFFLAQETSKLIYDLCTTTSTENLSSLNLNVNSTTYNLIKTILATNTLMSKLTKCYNLYEGLNDPIINTRISDEWVPYTTQGKLVDGKDLNEVRIYEEEFLGDFFESYMAALLIEQPNIAKAFIREIYKRLLSVITETLPPQVTYQNWTMNILGRNIYCKKEVV
ncbi:uncharacterized protein KGF55_005236 [Candida pseudojiufengensis]|uniref:uncharacterized protein n=1 Tax=Candida pseudojiufengensis TaxID=497109 RepID=UPI0022250375|nr:uncharacterized protein KGF55_005236 [Candida pseudojiufengensis]KAI5959592.1 hypothetical protein KGF55_005236 [Candida pseudojiufengensis]